MTALTVCTTIVDVTCCRHNDVNETKATDAHIVGKFVDIGSHIKVYDI